MEKPNKNFNPQAVSRLSQSLFHKEFYRLEVSHLKQIYKIKIISAYSLLANLQPEVI